MAVRKKHVQIHAVDTAFAVTAGYVLASTASTVWTAAKSHAQVILKMVLVVAMVHATMAYANVLATTKRHSMMSLCGLAMIVVSKHAQVAYTRVLL